jgi:hypothetical protein
MSASMLIIFIAFEAYLTKGQMSCKETIDFDFQIL